MRTLLLFTLLLSLVLSCSEQYKAEQKLATSGIEWSEEHFILASQAGNGAAVTIFINAGMNPNITDAKGLSPLLLFANSGDREMVKYLLEKSDTMLTDNTKRNALHHALLNHHFNLTALLLKAGVDPLQSDNFGRTALHYAAGATGKANNKSVALLVKAKCPVNKRDKEQNSPLAYAALAGNLPVVKTIIEAGGSIAIRNGHGETLHQMVRKTECNTCSATADWLEKEYKKRIQTLE
ncbi:ankyrin repeat domain-containing protein [bacterium]|nr:ankyrin repeat domain-containing protein [bacterium]